MLFEKCPLCGSYKNSRVFDFTDDYKIVKCENCNHTYTKISKEIELENFYTNGDYAEYDAGDSIFEKIIDYENKKVLKKIEKYISKRKILDFGCGKGKFLKIAKKRSWETFGVETSLPRAKYAKITYGLDISSDYFQGGHIGPSPYNVISLFHVLEHVPDPAFLLRKLVEDNLVQDGLLLIEVPNFNSLQAKIAKSNWLHLDIPRHINHFKLEILKSLFETNGLTIIKVEYFHDIHGLLGMLNSIFNLFGYRKNIMSELKYRRNKGLIISVLFVLPIAFCLEIVASMLKKGAVIRIFGMKI